MMHIAPLQTNELSRTVKVYQRHLRCFHNENKLFGMQKAHYFQVGIAMSGFLSPVLQAVCLVCYLRIAEQLAKKTRQITLCANIKFNSQSYFLPLASHLLPKGRSTSTQ